MARAAAKGARKASRDKTTPKPAGGSVDPAEVARFSAMAEEWWDPGGGLKPLHKLNPVRLAFIRDRVAGHYRRDPLAHRPLDGLRLVDVGTGGGLLAEPMTRLGARVTGIDVAEDNVRMAQVHAREGGLDIDYRVSTAEALAQAGETFDVVLNMEVVEHVADRGGFLDACCRLVRPGGVMVVATLNRTAKAFALAIVGAEYVLRWLPVGTHRWSRFVRPSELAAGLRRSGLDVVELTGVVYNPLSDRWHLAPGDVDVNYMAFAVKPPQGR
ncbi:MAG: bifunctional 2-polyprenyl-6-hydroxyphenol methylase/3-demethylubiquinol 3-O-methyltransferase UbiG [Kiloniellales bacterium]